MARYYPVSPLLWDDTAVRRWDDASRLLAVYLLTCRHRNLEGLYRLPWTYVESDLSWSTEKVSAAVNTLIDDDFIEYDPEAEVVFVRNALKYQSPKSKLQIKGALNALEAVPSTELMDAFVEAAGTHAPDFRKALASHSNGFGK
ncbi:MAG: hypothetical protein H0U55_13945 [Rubrobacteraceae bacterium]|nr:hypothetical protein [Rubrobacteraceae bacterium]